jgi:hypothetical protein
MGFRNPIRPGVSDMLRNREKKGRYMLSAVLVLRRSSHASPTRLAMPASASFPQARGSYAFLFPTSPSTFSTPS